MDEWWSTSQIPENACLARVLPLCKKGDTYLPSNYRPISLLDSVYRMYMCLIRNRLQVVLDPTLSANQYGFRPSRSTSHAMFFTRRVQDIAKERGTDLIVTLLDWEKAFDRMAIVLARVGVRQHFIDVLIDGYVTRTQSSM